MRGVETRIQEIRHRIFREVARTMFMGIFPNEVGFLIDR